jgi:hypothetical protein
MGSVRSALLAALLGLTGCPGACSQEMEHGSGGGSTDAAGSDSDAGGAGQPCNDAGPPPDASALDASTVDASVPDASPYDGGPLDAGSDPCDDDAGPGTPDAGR